MKGKLAKSSVCKFYMNIAALRFRVNNDYQALIYPVGAYDIIDWKNQEACTR